MTASPEETSTPNAAESPDAPAAASAAPAAPAAPTTPELGARFSRLWSFTILAAAALATAATAVLLLGGRPGASQESPALADRTRTPATRAVAPPSSSRRVELGRPAAPKWTGSKQPGWATDGSRTIAFELAAESHVPVWMKRVRPVLAVRCLGGATEVFVVTQSAASVEDDKGSHTVRVGFDAGADVEQQWTDSTDYQSLFAPDGEALARQIARSTWMRFEFTPYSAAPVVADFDVRGFDRFVDSVAKVCRWK